MLAAGLLLSACSKDTPFGQETEEKGEVLKSALDMTASGGNVQVSKKATRADLNLDDFKVAFVKAGNTIASSTYRYGDMPDVVTLTAGTYKAVASYGENREAEWESPYYLGESKDFDVNPYDITSYIDPIECSLQNVKASIAFDASLAGVMSSDSYVEVKVGDNNGLHFGLEEANAGKAGYYRLDGETTLVATFNGTVNGSRVVETKSYSNVQKGYWYKITFKLHNPGGGTGGTVGGEVVVDASVNVDDVNRDVKVADDDPLDDSERPKENPDDPNPPEPGKAPQILPGSEGMVFDTPWNVTASTPCAFRIVSTAEGGFQELTCEIISNKLTPEELAGIGLQSRLDLVNRDAANDYWPALEGLGFPTNMGGKKEANFDISTFMGMMAIFGSERHEFKLHVKDANGETTKSLILQF